MRTFLFTVTLAFGVCFLLTPRVLQLARRVGAIDVAGKEARKVHVHDIPRLGGLAIVAGFYLPIAAVAAMETTVWRYFSEDSRLAVGILFGSAIVALLGIYDDLRGARARHKLVVQLVAAGFVYALGFRVEVIDLPLLPILDLGWLGLPLTLLWIVGVTNAVNLIDGLDGLASGIGLFGLLPVVVLGLVYGDQFAILVGGALVGSLLGFLVFNWHPARIFMGDTGSMFLGFVLAVMTVRTSGKGPAAVSFLTAVLALGVPILDTLLSIVRRAWVGTPIFGADKGHLHHRLIAMGFSHRRVVLILYSVSACFAASGLLLYWSRDARAGLILISTLLVSAALLRWLGYLRAPEGGLRLAAERRRKTVALRRRVRALDGWMKTGPGLDEIAEQAEQLAREAGAAGGRLALAPDGCERTWEWRFAGADVPSAAKSVSLALDGPTADQGLLELRFDDPDESFESRMPALEQAAERLAAAWRQAEPNEGLPHPVSVPGSR